MIIVVSSLYKRFKLWSIYSVVWFYGYIQMIPSDLKESTNELNFPLPPK